MKFLCVGYFDPVKMDALSPEKVDAAMCDCPRHMDTLYATGRVAVVAGADNAAKRLQLTGGTLAVSDDTRETRAKIGCVFILEAVDLEEALRLAALHPTTQVAAGEALGWYTEVRPVHEFYRGSEDLLGVVGKRLSAD